MDERSVDPIENLYTPNAGSRPPAFTKTVKGVSAATVRPGAYVSGGRTNRVLCR